VRRDARVKNGWSNPSASFKPSHSRFAPSRLDENAQHCPNTSTATAADALISAENHHAHVAAGLLLYGGRRNRA